MTWSSAIRWIVRRLARDGRRTLPAVTDAGLLALPDAFMADDRALRALLGDGRDTDELPDYAALADRRAELARRIAATPARNVAGLLAKARCGRLAPAERDFDATVAICASLADDLLCIGDLSPSSSPSFFRSNPDTAPPQTKEQIMNDVSKVDRRLAIVRRNEMWRQSTQSLAMIGAFAVVALVGLPVNGVPLTWTGLIVLLATAIGTIGLSFALLRFIDPAV